MRNWKDNIVDAFSVVLILGGILLGLVVPAGMIIGIGAFVFWMLYNLI